MADIDTILDLAVYCREQAVEAIGDEYGEELACACAIVSAKLHEMYVAEGIESKIIVADTNFGCHCFLQVEEQFLVDITASQFGEDDICFLDWDDVPYRWYWKSDRKNPRMHEFGTVEELLTYQKKAGWPRNQLAQDYEYCLQEEAEA